jgi:5'-phosphate synthase pdxT subunit
MGKIGVLAMQGAFAEHLQALRKLSVEAEEVRLPKDLKGVAGLIIPGGESTAISRMMQVFGLVEPLKELHQQGVPIWGTCAGMILLAKELTDDNRVTETFGFIEVKVRRNAFGRQVDSFEEDLVVSKFGPAPFHGVFIRAPVLESVGPGVEVLARLSDGSPVAARQGPVLVTAFHPELTTDTRFHAYFIGLTRGLDEGGTLQASRAAAEGRERQ